MTITKLAIQEEQLAIVLGFAEILPSDTKIFINNVQVPIQAIYTIENGFSPSPQDRDQFSIAFSWLNIDNWSLGDDFSIINSQETKVVSNYGSGFEL